MTSAPNTPPVILRLIPSPSVPSRSDRVRIMASGSLVQKILTLPIDNALKACFQNREGKSLSAKLDRVPQQEEKAIELTRKAFRAAQEQQAWLFTKHHDPMITDNQSTHPQYLRNRALDALHNGKTVEQKLLEYDGKPEKKEKLMKLVTHLTSATGARSCQSDVIMPQIISKLIWAFCLEARDGTEQNLLEQYKAAYIDQGDHINTCSALFRQPVSDR